MSRISRFEKKLVAICVTGAIVLAPLSESRAQSGVPAFEGGLVSIDVTAPPIPAGDGSAEPSLDLSVQIGVGENPEDIARFLANDLKAFRRGHPNAKLVIGAEPETESGPGAQGAIPEDLRLLAKRISDSTGPDREPQGGAFDALRDGWGRVKRSTVFWAVIRGGAAGATGAYGVHLQHQVPFTTAFAHLGSFISAFLFALHLNNKFFQDAMTSEKILDLFAIHPESPFGKAYLAFQPFAVYGIIETMFMIGAVIGLHSMGVETSNIPFIILTNIIIEAPGHISVVIDRNRQKQMAAVASALPESKAEAIQKSANLKSVGFSSANTLGSTLRAISANDPVYGKVAYLVVGLIASYGWGRLLYRYMPDLSKLKLGMGSVFARLKEGSAPPNGVSCPDVLRSPSNWLIFSKSLD